MWYNDAIIYEPHVGSYFGRGDECHLCYHFPVMPLVDIMEQTPEIPENCQWAMFLRNHDELTLGIRRRLAPEILSPSGCS